MLNKKNYVILTNDRVKRFSYLQISKNVMELFHTCNKQTKNVRLTISQTKIKYLLTNVLTAPFLIFFSFTYYNNNTTHFACNATVGQSIIIHYLRQTSSRLELVL